MVRLFRAELEKHMGARVIQPRRLLGRSAATSLSAILLIGVPIIWTALTAPSGSAPLGPDPAAMLTALFGGLALFLFGLEQMTTYLKEATGDGMRSLLGRLTANRVVGAACGATVTAVIQSSSVTTVLLVGFVSAGLMSFQQSLSVVMGANIGTTVTAQIVAFKITAAALPMVATGFAVMFMARSERARQAAGVVLGLGLVFLGMSVMGDAMRPLREYQPFLDLVIAMETPLIGVLIGAAFTAVIQSSSATTSIAVVMASQGLITLPAGIAIALGANIGTCVTAALASLGKPRDAQRVAVGHIAFNVFGVLLWVFLIDQLAAVAIAISPVAEGLAGVDRLAAETPRRIANANTLFNVANTLMLLPATALMSRWIIRLVPDRREDKVIVRPKYLDEELVDTPALALDRVKLELAHVAERLLQMVDDLKLAFDLRDRGRLMEVRKSDDEIDILYRAIMAYLARVSQEGLTTEDAERYVIYGGIAHDLESMGDDIERDVVKIGSELIDMGEPAVEATERVLARLHGSLRSSVLYAIEAIRQEDEVAAHNILLLADEVERAVAAVQLEGREHIAADPRTAELYRLEAKFSDRLADLFEKARRLAIRLVPQPVIEND